MINVPIGNEVEEILFETAAPVEVVALDVDMVLVTVEGLKDAVIVVKIVEMNPVVVVDVKLVVVEGETVVVTVNAVLVLVKIVVIVVNKVLVEMELAVVVEIMLVV